MAPLLSDNRSAQLFGYAKALGSGQPPAKRARLRAEALTGGFGDLSAHCEVAAMLGGRLGVSEEVLHALAHAYERWDGNGSPSRIAGEEVPLEIRITMVARDVDLLGEHDIADLLMRRRGKAYDPAVVDTYLRMAPVRQEADCSSTSVRQSPSEDQRSGPRHRCPTPVGTLRTCGRAMGVAQPTSSCVGVDYLVTLGSVGLFVLVLLVVRRWTASATSYLFVLFPVVTMLLGAWLADEPLTTRGIIGAVVVMSGVWFGALAPPPDGHQPDRTPDVDSLSQIGHRQSSGCELEFSLRP